MTRAKGYLHVPDFLPKSGEELGVDLHLHLAENQTVVFFRGKRHVLTDADMEKLSKLPGSLLVPESQRDALTRWMSSGVNTILEVADKRPDEPLDPDQLKQTATSLVCTLEEATKDQYGDITPNSNALLNEVSDLVEQVVVRFHKTASAKQYEELLKNSRGNAVDPLQAHQRQVSALSVILMMSSGQASMEELSELATAGLVHDLGLGEITLSIRDRHILGMDGEFSPSEKLVHMKHAELGLEHLRTRGIPLTPGAMKIVQQHHENWDGSGFRGLKGADICRAARALRIADDLVAWMGNIMNAGGLTGAFGAIKEHAHLYDPAMMMSFETCTMTEAAVN